jgi:hypothetical protein
VSKYLIQILLAISFLALFQDSLDFGKSLKSILFYYSELRDLIFTPLDFITLELNERSKNTLIFIILVASAFGFRGNTMNKASVLIFINSLLLALIGIIIVGIGIFITGQETLNKIDKGSMDVSVFENIRYFISMIFFFAGGILICSLYFGFFCLLCPFLMWVLSKLPFYGNIIRKSFPEMIELSISNYEKVFPNQAKRIKFQSSELIAKRFMSIWPLKEYLDYYQPFFNLLKVAIILILIFKVVVDSF